MSDLKKAVENIYAAVAMAESISDETGELFTLDISYGMGGTYDPEMENDHDGSNWHPSSLSC